MVLTAKQEQSTHKTRLINNQPTNNRSTIQLTKTVQTRIITPIQQLNQRLTNPKNPKHLSYPHPQAKASLFPGPDPLTNWLNNPHTIGFLTLSACAARWACASISRGARERGANPDPDPPDPPPDPLLDPKPNPIPNWDPGP